jgi:predicted ABC-type ATPase
MCLDNVKACDIRVQHRVKSGGHNVSPKTIQQIYKDNLKFLNALSTKIDRIDLYDNTKMPKLLASFEKGVVLNATPEASSKTWIKEGLPQLSEKLRSYLQQSNKNVFKYKL